MKFNNLSMRFLLITLALCATVSGCSINQLAMNKLGDALASSGSGFGADDDPELVGLAAPFSLKLMESILAETPRHRGLLLAATQGFVQYGYAFVELNADTLEDRDLQAAHVQRERARRLYLRARNYGLRGLEAAYPGITQAIRSTPAEALAKTTREDAGLLYWTGVAWAAAISQSKDDPFLIADLPVVEALVRRALALDESYDHGGIHVFMISFEMGSMGADAARRARRHYARALELSEGKHAGPHVTFAEAVSVAERNRTEFEQILREALKVNAAAKPEWQLVNTVMQRRARWLLGRMDRLFAD
jgi:predicted anti-sigma-YlaC factor YlaD